MADTQSPALLLDVYDTKVRLGAAACAVAALALQFAFPPTTETRLF